MNIKVKIFTGSDIDKLEKQITWFLEKGDKKNKDKNWIIEIKHTTTNVKDKVEHSIIVIYK